MSEERRPIMPWILAVVIGLPALYLASFGPACWITSRANSGENVISTIYAPITMLMAHPLDRASRINAAIHWYSQAGAAPGWGWIAAVDENYDVQKWNWVRWSP
jgi:hypothetical protein